MLWQQREHNKLDLIGLCHNGMPEQQWSLLKRGRMVFAEEHVVEGPQEGELTAGELADKIRGKRGDSRTEARRQ